MTATVTCYCQLDPGQNKLRTVLRQFTHEPTSLQAAWARQLRGQLVAPLAKSANVGWVAVRLCATPAGLVELPAFSNTLIQRWILGWVNKLISLFQAEKKLHAIFANRFNFFNPSDFA